MDSNLDKFRPVLDDLDGNVVFDVGGFYEKYFDNKSWSEAARNVVKSYKESSTPSGPDSRTEKDFRTDFLSWFTEFQATIPPGHNNFNLSAMQPLDGFNVEDTPTIYLTHGEQKPQPSWADIAVIGQVSSSDQVIQSEDRVRFCMHAWRLFNNQPTRLFLHGFYIYGRVAQLWVFDRNGAYASKPLDLDREGDRFLQVITSYAMMNHVELGLNTCVEKDGVGSFVTFPKNQGNEHERLYLEDTPIRKFPGITYKGPTCYRARRVSSDEWEFVIKFAWRRTVETPEEEITGLVTERNVWGVVHLFGHLDITTIKELRSHLVAENCRASSLRVSERKFSVGQELIFEKDNFLNDDNAIAGSGSGDSVLVGNNRKFYCVAIHPVGRPMENYKSALELVYAFRDITKGHRSLYVDGHILHRDVSKDNIMISDVQQEGTPKGFLIDLDAAINLKRDTGMEETGTGTGRKGTKPFMAIGVLLAETHTYRHDLESLFYCFLWVAICGREKKWPPKASRLWAWLQGSFEECARRKSEDMGSTGFEKILDEFPEDLAILKTLARDLWRILFPKPDDARFLHDDERTDPSLFYQSLLEAFDQAAAVLNQDS
ncbi:hypothetical protein ACHAPO_012096 [Fusarium lateritium]